MGIILVSLGDKTARDCTSAIEQASSDGTMNGGIVRSRESSRLDTVRHQHCVVIPSRLRNSDRQQFRTTT